MGSFIEINDTLQLTRAQGFPKELNLRRHRQKPFSARSFTDKIFQFKNKDGLRVFHSPPVRVFLVENVKEKWIYWGLCQIVEQNWDCVKRITSGKFKIIQIFSPEEMAQVFEFVDRRQEKNYFSK